MALVIDAHLGACKTPVNGRRTTFGVRCAQAIILPRVPSGALRIGGDSPDGLVLVGAAPAARTVDLLDRETRVFVATTVSAGDGTYAFTGLSARPDGYDVIGRGNLADGERDFIVPGVHPGSP